MPARSAGSIPGDTTNIASGFTERDLLGAVRMRLARSRLQLASRVLVGALLVTTSAVAYAAPAGAAPAWSIVPSAAPSGARSAAFQSVSCSSATSCFAVGGFTDGRWNNALAERWNGTSWSRMPIPSATTSAGGGTYLRDVACASPTSCFAVGISQSNGQDKTLIERWNGTVWSIVPSPNPSGAMNSGLFGVTCLSTTSCFAVGLANSGVTPRTLIERWNGTAWSIVASPNPAGATNSWLDDLSCPSAASCFAVGSVKNDTAVHTLIERWNGASWTVSSSPNPDPAADELDGVTCPGPTDCFAVGLSGSLSVPGIIERWNGTSWSIVAHPVPAPPNNTLSAVSCSSATTCFGVGRYATASGTIATLIERPNGTSWSTVASPNPAGSVNSSLAGVSCPSATNCFAVGTSGNSPTKTLIERWNGSTWSIVPSPNRSSTSSNRLRSISCPSATSCFAVGSFDNGTVKTLVERWNGTAWSIVASPNQSSAETNMLESVSCADATSCVAVGQYLDQPVTYSKTLVERWNGTAWSIVTSPNPAGAVESSLAGVSCPSATSCFAAGDWLATSASTKSLIERWNGATWSVVTSADRASATHSTLSGISCSSVTSCVAVGGDHGSSGQYETLVKVFSGTTWSIAPSPNPTGATDAFLRAVSCPATTNCFAAGDFDKMSAPRTLVERYS
jgi:hypothetical protein